MSHRFGNTTDHIIKLAKDAGARGICTTELSGYTTKAADVALNRLVVAGSLFKGKAGHKTVRYFLRAEWALAFEDANRVEPASVRVRASKAKWAPAQKGVISPTEGITAATKFTRWVPPVATLIRTDTHES